uniref:Uncharacterized protein n=1 Tax=Anguilla anguilla TaxID=7936 RepID=A0A0E9S3F5_ANGAN
MHGMKNWKYCLALVCLGQTVASLDIKMSSLHQGFHACDNSLLPWFLFLAWRHGKILADHNIIIKKG